MSTIALHSTLNILNILENVRYRGSVPKDTSRKWHMGYRMVRWPMTLKRCCIKYGRSSRRQL